MFGERVSDYPLKSPATIPVDNLQYFDEVTRIIAIQPFEPAYKKETVAGITVISEVFHLIDTTSAVEIDVTGRFAVLIQGIEKVTTYPPCTGNVVLEHVQTVICPL